jgi:class 3 adenylate cyclase/sensor domain CHASE-containing protein
MNLRTKMLFPVSITMVVFIAILFFVVSSFLQKNYSELELQSANRDLQRLQQVFLSDLDQLQFTVVDWAYWNDTHRYMKKRNHSYISSNLSTDTVLSLNYNFVILIDMQGEIIFKTAVDLEKQRNMLMPEELVDQIYFGSPLLDVDGKDTEIAGLISVDGKALMVAVSPILRSDGSGAPLGKMIMARYIDEKRVAETALKTQLTLDVRVIGSSDLTSDMQRLIDVQPDNQDTTEVFKAQAPTQIDIIDEDMLYGYTLYSDIEGNPLLMWKVEIPRSIYQQGQLSLRYVLIAMIIVGIALIISVILLNDNMVLRRLLKLSDEVSQIGKSNDLSTRVENQGTDELSKLGTDVNWMLEQLEKTNLDVVENSQMLESLSTKLSKYLSPQVYESIFSGKQSVGISSQRKKLTVFFSDIANFTETTDQMESEDLTQLLNHYLTEMSTIALAHGATIDKYIGDAIVIFFGDPETRGVKDDALACVKMAIAMRERMLELEVTWRDSGIEKPLKCRIGINTGYCTVGTFGSEDRMDYTIIGGGVNLAARLESAADSGEILVSYETYANVKREINCEEFGQISVKGIAYPVETYQVIGHSEIVATSDQTDLGETSTIKLDIDVESMSEKEREQATASLKQALDKLSKN